MNLFMILQSDFLHHIKSNTALLRAVVWGYEQETLQYKDLKDYSLLQEIS